jgi:hypothetical protein
LLHVQQPGNDFKERIFMTAKALTESDLAQFSGGTEHWYRHGLVRTVLFTDGAKHVADAGGAYWLLDEIALAQRFEKKVAAEEFQVWKLTVKDNAGVLRCEDGNDNLVLSKNIEFTDFPLPEITLWFTDNTILLPHEY